MSFQDQLAIERFRYWQGQMLRSQDFRDQTATDALFRWWHNRAVHEAYGVSIGLTVTPILDATNTLIAVEVEPGAAHDCFGRTLLLQRPERFVLPAPPAQTAMLVLGIRYRDTKCFPSRAEILPACSCYGNAALQESPEFFWSSADTFQVTDGVPLFRIAFKGGIPGKDDSFVVPSARPLARPHVASGCTIRGNTPWKPWNVTAFEGPWTIGAQTVIDTSAAGFTQTPHYIAWLQDWDTQVVPGESIPWVLTHVQEPSSTGFLFRVLWLGVDQGLVSSAIPVMGASYVCWLGCEEVGGSAVCTRSSPSCGCSAGTELLQKQE